MRRLAGKSGDNNAADRWRWSTECFLSIYGPTIRSTTLVPKDKWKSVSKAIESCPFYWIWLKNEKIGAKIQTIFALQSCQRDIKRLKEREFQLHSELLNASSELQRLRLLLRDHHALQQQPASLNPYEGSPV